MELINNSETNALLNLRAQCSKLDNFIDDVVLPNFTKLFIDAPEVLPPVALPWLTVGDDLKIAIAKCVLISEFYEVAVITELRELLTPYSSCAKQCTAIINYNSEVAKLKEIQKKCRSVLEYINCWLVPIDNNAPPSDIKFFFIQIKRYIKLALLKWKQ